MLAVIRFQHRSMGEAELLNLLRACFSLGLPVTDALSRSRRFRSVSNIPPAVLYACQPTINSLATFFRLSDRTLECVLEDDQEKAETIYQACEFTVREVLQRFRNHGAEPRLRQLYLEEDSGRRTDTSAQMLSFREALRAKLELRDWILRVVNAALLIAASFQITGLLNAVYVGMIGFGATFVVSIVESILEVRGQALTWRIG